MILNKKEGKLINLENSTCIRITDSGNIQIDFIGCNGTKIATYSNYFTAVKALQYITDNLNKNVITLPDEETLNNMYKVEKQHYHHMDGRKTKGHGGS